MLAVFAYSHKETWHIRNLLKWISELQGNMSRHRALLVASSRVDLDDVRDVSDMATCIFHKVDAIRQREEDERGWPQSCNSMFRVAYYYVRDTLKIPFWWNETDCIPLKTGWLDALENEYNQVKKPFMGRVVDKPFPHLTGCAIYPPNIENWNPHMLAAVNLAWDVMSPHLTIPYTHNTELFHHEWGNAAKNIAPTYPTRWSVRSIPSEAVVSHRNKDHTLIERLREMRRRPDNLIVRKLKEVFA